MVRDDMTHLDQERLEHSGRSDLEASVEERGGDLLENRAGLTEAGLGRSVTEGDGVVKDSGRKIGYRRERRGEGRDELRKSQEEAQTWAVMVSATPISTVQLQPRLPHFPTARGALAPALNELVRKEWRERLGQMDGRFVEE
jgi:hypothetical protein